MRCAQNFRTTAQFFRERIAPGVGFEQIALGGGEALAVLALKPFPVLENRLQTESKTRHYATASAPSMASRSVVRSCIP